MIPDARLRARASEADVAGSSVPGPLQPYTSATRAFYSATPSDNDDLMSPSCHFTTTGSVLGRRCFTFGRSRMDRSYNGAVEALNTLQSNHSIVSAVRKSGGRMNESAKEEMQEWVHRLGYEPADLNQLNAIHIAGTKGKGSTSAFTSWILAQYLPSTSQTKPLFQKIGLYTSPHLRFVRERIQINNEPLSEEMFAKYFFETWDRFEQSAATQGATSAQSEKPMYFRFLTLMAFHTFISEGVDTAVVECGIGGEYDSTNVFEKPSCTGITSLGIDHTALLGNTIDQIAWHKAGIMKANAPSFTAPQPPSALEVLSNRAEAAHTSLKVVSEHPALDRIQLGLAGEFQKINASVAVALAATFLQSKNRTYPDADSILPEEFVLGLEKTQLQGRCQIRKEGRISWHLDCGHTLESIEVAGKWYASQVRSTSQISSRAQSTRILLFNQQTRDANALALALHSHLKSALEDDYPFTHAVFCTNVTYAAMGYKADLVSMNVDKTAVENLEVQRALAETWKSADADTEIQVEKSIEEAILWCRGIAREDDGEVSVLVTGSVHLVGGVLEVLESA